MSLSHESGAPQEIRKREKRIACIAISNENERARKKNKEKWKPKTLSRLGSALNVGVCS